LISDEQIHDWIAENVCNPDGTPLELMPWQRELFERGGKGERIVCMQAARSDLFAKHARRLLEVVGRGEL